MSKSVEVESSRGPGEITSTEQDIDVVSNVSATSPCDRNTVQNVNLEDTHVQVLDSDVTITAITPLNVSIPTMPSDKEAYVYVPEPATSASKSIITPKITKNVPATRKQSEDRENKHMSPQNIESHKQGKSKRGRPRKDERVSSSKKIKVKPSPRKLRSSVTSKPKVISNIEESYEETEKRLCSLWKQNPMLYDPQHADYKKIKERRQVWEEIAKKMDLPGRYKS